MKTTYYPPFSDSVISLAGIQHRSGTLRPGQDAEERRVPGGCDHGEHREARQQVSRERQCRRPGN
jgi:hypothetical protein